MSADKLPENNGPTRREFIQLALAAGVYVTVEQFVGASETGNIPYRTLGSTGVKVSIIGIGGFHLGNASSDEEGARMVHTALDNGINFMDNCWDYHDGMSEQRMGKALKGGYRQKAFLMSKIDSHSRDGAAKQIDESLKRLQTDHVDLMQFHEVIRPDDPEKIFAKGGSAEAMLAAKQAGKVRHIGFTGHKDPKIHLHMLDVVKQNAFPLETVQMPLNVLDAHFNSFTKLVLPRLVEMKLGVLGMKPISAGAAVKSAGVTAPECLRYALSLPTSVVITGCENMRDIEQALKVAREFKPLTETERAALLKRTAEVAANGKLEGYKTSHEYDGTINNPQWLA